MEMTDRIKRLILNPEHPVISVVAAGLLFPVVAKVVLGLMCYALGKVVPEEFLYPASSVYDVPVAVLVLLVVFVLPLAEEFFFRFVLFKKMLLELFSLPVKYAVILNSVFFAIWHLNIYQGMYAFMTGFYMAYVYYKKGKITYPLLFHCVSNIQALMIELLVRVVFKV